MTVVPRRQIYLTALSILLVVLLLLVFISVSTYRNLNRERNAAMETVHRQALTLINALEAGARAGMMMQIAGINPGTPVVIMTAYGSVRSAVEALKAGARDYLTKPIDVDELKILVTKTLHHRKLEEEMILKTLENMGGNRTQTAQMLGISRRTLQLKLKDYGIN